MSSDCFAPATNARTSASTVATVSAADALRSPTAPSTVVPHRRNPRSAFIASDTPSENSTKVSPGSSGKVSRSMGLDAISPAGRSRRRTREPRRTAWREDRELVVSGARARHAALCSRSNTRHCIVTNMPRGFCFGELVVEAAENLGGVGDVPRERTQDRHGDGHEERGRNPLPRHVAQRDDDAVVGGAQHFIEVAANLLCRLDDRVHVQTGAAASPRRDRRAGCPSGFRGRCAGRGPSPREWRRHTPWP